VEGVSFQVMSGGQFSRVADSFVQGLSAQFAALYAALVQRVVRDTRRRFGGHPTP